MIAVPFLTALAFLLALYFPVMLLIRSDWQANIAGKSQMVFSCIVAAVLGLGTLRGFGVDLPDWFRSAIYILIIVGLLLQDIALTKIQNRRADRIASERESIKEPS